MSEPTVDSATAAPTDCGLSYAFARRSGVLVKTDENGCLLCSHRIPLKLETRLEVQRVFGPDVQFVPVDEETFEAASPGSPQTLRLRPAMIWPPWPSQPSRSMICWTSETILRSFA